MSYDFGPGVTDIPREAAADYRLKQYYCMKYTDGGIVTIAGANEKVCGVLQNKPNIGEQAIVRISGITKVYMGETLTVGELVTSTAAGDAEQVDAAGEFFFGMMVDGATDNNYGHVQLMFGDSHAAD